MNKPVAIFFQIEPGQKIVGEGIAQYTDRVISGFCELNQPVEIYAPIWAESQIKDFLKWTGHPKSLVRAKICGSPIIGLLVSLRKRSRKADHDTLLFSDPKYAPKDLSDILIEKRGYTILLGALSPLIILFSVIFLPFLLALLVSRKLFVGRLGRLFRALLGLSKFITYAGMAAAIDRRANACFVPIGSWAMCRLVKKAPVVVQIPDIVWADFPQHFPPSPEISKSVSEIRKVASHANAVTCPSHYVRRHHLINLLGVSEEKAKVCFHGPMTLSLKTPSGSGEEPTKAQAREILQSAITRALDADDGSYARRIDYDMQREVVLRTFSADARPIIYYPTQNRPYKNFETVFGALHELKTLHSKNVRLMLTADLSLTPKLMQEIKRRGLINNVILLPRLPQYLHAVAYIASDIALSASYFEGGFTFNFSEALSVGRPCIASDIAASREIVPPDLATITLFKTDSGSHLASSINFALRNIDEVLQKQSEFQLKRSVERTWKDVARDYMIYSRRM